MNDRFLRALRREPVDQTPIWIMRQAGRYLPEYRKVRAQAKSFLNLCKTPELACEVTLQPLARFPFDAAILFSDILTIPDAMGLGLHFVDGEGPKFHSPVRNAKDIENLGKPDAHDDLGYVMKAVSLIRQELNGRVPLIGFSGSPWTLATYMIEGGSSRDFALAKGMLFAAPQQLHRLLQLLADTVADYLIAQMQAGAQALMIFDSWGGALAHDCYQQFSLTYMQQIVQKIKAQPEAKGVPIILFTKGGALWLEAMATSGADALGVDWTVNIGEARTRVGGQVALQGNLDPAVLYAPAEIIEQEVEKVLCAYGRGTGHIFNLGHGIHPGIEPEKVAILVDSVHTLSKKYQSD
jgi:uroporphyrinogen decarboxylase